MTKISSRQHRISRRIKIRSKIKGTNQVPRVSIFRSNKHLMVQIIDDASGKTLVSAHDLETKKSRTGKTTESRGIRAAVLGKTLAGKAKEAGIKKVVFDRGGYKYHGRVKALAEGLREGGLDF